MLLSCTTCAGRAPRKVRFRKCLCNLARRRWHDRPHLALIGMKLALNALSGEPEQPDVPNASCCGEADAYWVGQIQVRDGKTCTTIIDDRADEPRGRPRVGVAFPGAASSAMLRRGASFPRNMRAGAGPWLGAALV